MTSAFNLELCRENVSYCSDKISKNPTLIVTVKQRLYVDIVWSLYFTRYKIILSDERAIIIYYTSLQGLHNTKIEQRTRSQETRTDSRQAGREAMLPTVPNGM